MSENRNRDVNRNKFIFLRPRSCPPSRGEPWGGLSPAWLPTESSVSAGGWQGGDVGRASCHRGISEGRVFFGDTNGEKERNPDDLCIF